MWKIVKIQFRYTHAVHLEHQQVATLHHLLALVPRDHIRRNSEAFQP